MKSFVSILFLIFFFGLPKYSEQTFWRLPAKPTLPSNPKAPIYNKLQKIPSPQKTAQMILDNFVRYQPGRISQRVLPAFDEDIVIVMDGSASIGDCEFKQGKKAMLQMMKLCPEKGGGYSCLYSAVTFSTSTTVNFKFSLMTPANRKMMPISYPMGGTNTAAALDEAEKIIREGMKYRPVARRMVLLLTDGLSNDKLATIASAKKVKSISGVEIFVIAIGGHIYGIDEMAKVASYPPDRYVFRVKKNSKLSYVFELALHKMNPRKYHTAILTKSLC